MTHPDEIMPARQLLVALLFLVLTSNSILNAESPADRYREAARVFCAHTPGDFLHDDSKDGVEALESMWNASAQAAIEVLASRPDAAASDLKTALGSLPLQGKGCGESDEVMISVVAIAPHLFLGSQFNGEAGTAFLVGIRGSKPALLWSIENASPQAADTQGLLGAWKADRAGGKCREKGSGHPPGTCGPLYADLGVLTPDSYGRPRFYVDAGYTQIMGATVGHQTSIWRWDGDSATLLWIDWHDFMIDQKIGTSFGDGVLAIGEKDNFRTFDGCGGCESRQMVRRIRIMPDGITDLGKTSTTPELDLIDELFWRIANGKLTADIASPEVARFLRPLIVDAKTESKKVDPHWFSVGMLEDVAFKREGDSEEACFTADDIGRLYFTILHDPGGAFRFVKVTQPEGEFGDCPK